MHRRMLMNKLYLLLSQTIVPTPMKVFFGPPTMTSQTTIGVTEDDLPTLPTEDLLKIHQEANGKFDGDRVLANSILFLQDFGWWAEIAFAVPEDDMILFFIAIIESIMPFG
jgi:hypothetical protein